MVSEIFHQTFPWYHLQKLIWPRDRDWETDVGLYFEIEEDKDAATFLEETGLSSLKIHLQFEPEARFNAYLDGGRPLNTLLGDYIVSSAGGYITTFTEQRPPTRS